MGDSVVSTTSNVTTISTATSMITLLTVSTNPTAIIASMTPITDISTSTISTLTANSLMPNCAQYGCVGYAPSNRCQCNDACTKFGSCCSDYADVCGKAMTLIS